MSFYRKKNVRHKNQITSNRDNKIHAFFCIILIQGLVTRAKKTFFRLVRYIPAVRNKIQNELDTIEKSFEKDMSKFGEGLGYLLRLNIN